MSKKLFEKAGMIQLPTAPAAAATPSTDAASTREQKPKTAPGSMMHFLGTQSSAVREADELRERVRSFDGALPVRKLDPRKVRPSRWANRDEASFATPEFELFKDELSAAGGNVQPVKVRPLKEPVEGFEYELVFGHRRHRGSLERGLPLTAMIEPLDDAALFVQMERENRSREDLSAWEQGVMYARALDEGLFASNRQLAAAIGRDLGDIGRAISLARLPSAVISAFKSPLHLQFRWAKPLSDAQQSDPEGLLARAKGLKEEGIEDAKSVFERLVASPGKAKTRKPVTIKGGAGRTAKLSFGEDGSARLEFSKNAIPPERQAAITELIREFLK